MEHTSNDGRPRSEERGHRAGDAYMDHDQDLTKEEFFDAEEYMNSFSALKDSMAQGRDLKKKRKALEEYNKTLDTLKKAYEDRVNIANNHDAILNDQKHIIGATEAEIEKANRSKEAIEAKIATANDAIAKMRKESAREKKPFEEQLDLRNSELASAKDELKQVKAQRDSLDLFDESGSSSARAEAAHDAVIESVSEKFEAAKSAQRDAQKALDAKEKEERAKLKKMQDGIKHLNNDMEKADKRIEELEKRLAACHERIAFCEHVLAHPEETAAMHDRILENQRTAAQMSVQIDSLASKHQMSKAASGKARIVLAVAIAFIVIMVVLFVYISNR